MATANSPIKEQLVLIDQVQGKVVDLAVQFGPRVVAAALILLAGYYVGRKHVRSRLNPPSA